MTGYIEQIDDLIAKHRAEIERLEIARSVMVELAPPPKAKVIEHRQPEPVNGKITIRRVPPQPAPVEAKAKAKGKAAKGPRLTPERQAAKKLLRDKILAALHDGPIASGALIERFLPNGTASSKNEKQTVYATMYDLKQAGVVVRGDDMVYSLTTTH